MTTREHLDEARPKGSYDPQTRLLSSASGSPPLSKASLLQQRPQQHLLDQRRHTVDYSAWNIQGSLDHFLSSVDQIASQKGTGSNFSNKQDNMASAWNSHSSEPSFTSYEREINSQDNLIGDKQRSSNKLYPNVFISQLNPSNGAMASMSDNFGRRASMSQLSFYGSVWDQPSQTLLHKHSNSLQMGYDGISFPVPASAAKRHTEGDSARIHSDWEKDISCTGTQIANRSDLAFLKENDSDQNLAHQTFLQRQSQQLQPTLASSRRNSRILPNPIQPPAISHARKQSVDEIVSKDQDHSLDKSIHPFSTNTSTASFSDLSIPEDDSLTISSSISSFSNTSSHSNSIQHGGFVPGYDPWATKNDKSSIDGANNISTGLNLQNQGPKSELILHDTSSNNLDYLAMKSIHQSSDSLGISSGYHPIRSTSPTNSGPSSGLPTSGTLLSGQTIAARPEPLQHEGNCPLSFVDNQESEQKGVESSASAQHMSLTQSPLHPHYESTISSESRSNPQSSEGPIMEICGLCGVQLATVHFGSCGHRICNVCHRHEKHRSFRLFQNASPPCPFCTHGVTPDQQLPSGKSILSYTDGTMKIRQYAFHHIPQQSYSGQTVSQQGPRQRFQRQRQTNPSSSSFDGVISDDMNEGFLLNRHYHQTFPIYGAATTAPPLRAPSLQLDSMPPAFSGNNSGSFSRSTDHFVQASINQKPPSGFYPFQSSAHPGQNSLRQHHPHKQGLNHHAPNFQPSGVLLAQQCQDNSNLAAMGRPGMITPPTGVWRDSGSGIVDYSSQEYVYQLQSSLPTQYLQQRRGSQQNTLLPSAIVNPSQGFSIYGHTMSNNTGPGATANSSSTTPYFPILPDLPPATPPTRLRTEAIQWAVIRITNIPWDVSLQDMLGFFAGIPVPPEHLLAQNVHILMDRASGKTFNSAFVELALTTRQAEIIAQARNQKVLKGRQVSVELSSQDELLRSVFPKWIGDFLNGEPSISGDRNTGSEAIGGNYDGQHITQWQLDSTKYVQPTPPFITRDEINALLVICRNYKLHFSRKCAERPFENILTILAKYPWHQPHRVLPMHRDHIFELLKLSIESLRMHLSKEYNTIHPTLLSRMVRCAILTPAFTERQKNMVLVVAGMACPEDLVGWMAPPAPVEVVSIPPDSSINSKDSDKGSIILSNSNDTSDKIERSSEMQLIDEAIDCLAISEPSTDSSICSIGDTRKDNIYDITTTVSTSSPTEFKQGTFNTTTTTWAAIVAPSTKTPEYTDSTSNESTPTATPVPLSVPMLNNGNRSLTLTSSYAAAVVQSPNRDCTLKPSIQSFQNTSDNLALGSNESGPPSPPSSLGTIVAHSSSDTHKSLELCYQHDSENFSSTSGNSSNTSNSTFPTSIATIPFSLPSLESMPALETSTQLTYNSFEASGERSPTSSTCTRHYRGESLPKVTTNRGANETTTSCISPLVAMPFGISSRSASPSTTGEKSTSESILNAIKTITQSTPRLSKSGSVNQIPISASGTLQGSTASVTGLSSSSLGGQGLGHKQQRREGGETL